jgi:hypothetical protein
MININYGKGENEMGTRVCKICGEEKPINEFRVTGSKSHDKNCRVCHYLSKHPNLIILNGWSIEQYRIVLDLVMHNKINYINDLVDVLKKNLADIVNLLSNTLIVHGGNFKRQVKVVCDNCKEEYSIPLHQFVREKEYNYCSRRCKDEHQKTFIGENNVRYTSEKIICDWCGKEHIKKQSQINRCDNNFCSVECRQQYFANVTVKTEEWINNNRELMLNNLTNGSINKVNTSIQSKVNDILNNIKIDYENERIFDYYSVDNYLLKYNLVLEICGSYWHSDPRIYPLIKNDMQLKRINLDKTKKSYLYNNYGINILYLWEYDINNNEKLVENLIKHFIINNGILQNYNSFNYSLNNGIIVLNDNIIKSYIEMSENEVQSKINLEKIESKKETYIIYNCDYCGKLNKKGKSKYETVKGKHFCNKECYVNYQRKNGKENHQVTFKCDFCNKEKTTNLYQYKIHKNHFCSKECSDEYKRKNKTK